MTLETIIQTYGYFAVFLGTFIEGETFLMLGGFIAHRGYLSLWGVIAAAVAGSLLGDQLYFYIGRRYGKTILEKRPKWKRGAERISRLLERHHTTLILGFRFLYGLRTLTPIVIGMSRVGRRRFAVLNAAGAIAWSVLVGLGGYLFGHALEAIIGHVERYELRIMGGIAAAGALLWLLIFLRKRT